MPEEELVRFRSDRFQSALPVAVVLAALAGSFDADRKAGAPSLDVTRRAAAASFDVDRREIAARFSRMKLAGRAYGDGTELLRFFAGVALADAVCSGISARYLMGMY